MKPTMRAILLTAVLSAAAAGQQSDLAIGRAYYNGGDFKKAASHFQMAIRTGTDGAAAYYWLGMSYQMLADITAPLGRKYKVMARVNLTKAAELAPNRLDYRAELFDFLVDSAGSSRSVRRQAADILSTVPESDPQYAVMRRRLDQARRASSAPDARLGGFFLVAPRSIYRMTELAW